MTPDDVPASDAIADGWDQGAPRRFAALAIGRAIAQALGIVWFLAAARLLDRGAFGDLATGLAFFAVFAGIGDLGTTRGVARHVAADHRTIRDAYLRALQLRLAGGLGVGLAVTGAVALAPVPVSAPIVLLAALVATASGATELAFAALRSVGRVRVELWLLLAERSAFLAFGTAVMLAGGGAPAVLAVYLVTNAVSAVVAGGAVLRAEVGVPIRAGSLIDREARYTAAGFALITVAPRIPSILVALFASATAVGAFAVAQRPIEAMTLFALSTAAPVLPIVRSRVARRLHDDAERAAVAVAGALLLAVAPVVAWFVVAPQGALDLLFGEGRFPESAAPLRLLALTAISWTLRGVGEFVLLAQERARGLFGLTALGAVVTLAVGVPAVLARAELGAAIAVVAAEVAMTAVLVAQAPVLFGAAALRAYVAAGAAMAGTGAAVLLVSDDPVVQGALVGACAVPAVLAAGRRLGGLERAP